MYIRTFRFSRLLIICCRDGSRRFVGIPTLRYRINEYVHRHKPLGDYLREIVYVNENQTRSRSELISVGWRLSG